MNGRIERTGSGAVSKTCFESSWCTQSECTNANLASPSPCNMQHHKERQRQHQLARQQQHQHLRSSAQRAIIKRANGYEAPPTTKLPTTMTTTTTGQCCCCYCCCCCCCCCAVVGVGVAVEVTRNKKNEKNGRRYEEHNGISSASEREKDKKRN